MVPSHWSQTENWTNCTPQLVSNRELDQSELLELHISCHRIEVLQAFRLKTYERLLYDAQQLLTAQISL